MYRQSLFSSWLLSFFLLELFYSFYFIDSNAFRKCLICRLFNKNIAFVHSVRRQLISKCSILACKITFIATLKTESSYAKSESCPCFKNSQSSQNVSNSGEQGLKMVGSFMFTNVTCLEMMKIANNNLIRQLSTKLSEKINKSTL